MAGTVQYGMGQLRYTSSSSYMTDKNFTHRAVKTMVSSAQDSGQDGGSEFYQDVYMDSGNFNFVSGVPYLLHLDMPKDSSYDCVYQIKMITAPNGNIDTSNLEYQLIKYITVPKMVGAGNTSRVLIYPVKTDGNPGLNADGSYTLKVAVAKTLDESPVSGDVIFDEGTYKYYVYKGSKAADGAPIIGNSVEILNKNDTVMEHTWATSDIESETVGFDIIFTPRSTNVSYAGIYIQMVRSSLDYDIYSDVEQVFGRKIDIKAFKGAVYELTNLINGSTVPTPLVNIGVYSHPNLLMAINGEEIRVGQSGYYELNDFDITSLAIAANNVNDKFTLDYQYKVMS